MRIVAGEFKNRTIHVPHDRSLETMSEMVREALFNILGDAVVDARFADLFAGSGSVGLEALSRGASRVTFVEMRRQAADAIRKTLEVFQVDKDRARVWTSDVFQLGGNSSEWSDWDIAFLDPPRRVKDNFLDDLVDRGVIGSEKLIVAARPVENCAEMGSNYLRLLDRRIYGKACLFFFGRYYGESL
ncbi:MAG: RsmD family RNA methyltransferase [Candidatus Omnitrophota bacterium]